MEENMRRAVFETLKAKINELLWSNLPPDCTLAAAEEIACELYDRITRAWDASEATTPGKE